jgi:cupin superfamily acireductone dioxygenase involved in methionine salvage
MLIEMLSRSENQLEQTEYNDKVVIIVNGKPMFEVHDGEVEDNYLYRNFQDVYSIPELMKMAYDAGQAGEELHIEVRDFDEGDD